MLRWPIESGKKDTEGKWPLQTGSVGWTAESVEPILFGSATSHPFYKLKRTFHNTHYRQPNNIIA